MNETKLRAEQESINTYWMFQGEFEHCDHHARRKFPPHYLIHNDEYALSVL